VPDWDEDSPALRRNLTRILEKIVQTAESREPLTVETARRWHTLMMAGLKVPNERYVGGFRGEPGLEKVQIKVAEHYGVPAALVAEELNRYEARLRRATTELDAVLPVGHEPNPDQRAAIIDLCAWARAEWVRIHPLANGNGRTARLWANSLAIRYNLPPFVRLRPRPEQAYAAAGAKAMLGEWKPTARVFRSWLDDILSGF